MNTATLIGNIGKDPEVRTLDNGTKVARFNIATTESWKGKDGQWVNDTTWHTIVAWRNLAETQMQKGNEVLVIGKISKREYEAEGGVKKEITEIVAATIKVLLRRERNNVPLPTEPEPRYFNDPESRDKEAEKEQFDPKEPTPF